MNFSDDDIKEFQIEAADLLDQAEDALLQLDKGEEFKPHYDAVFRVFHSLKGGAGMLGLSDLQAHMHKLENKMTETKARNVVSKPEVTFFLSGVDCARKLLAGEVVSFSYNIAEESDTAATKESKNESANAPTANSAEKIVTEADSEDISLVYIVDDEPDTVNILKEMLSKAGMRSEGFSNANELLEKINKKKPDVVVTDYKMPNITGMDLLREIRKADNDLPVIFISGFLSVSILAEAIQNGLFATIEKPFRSADVISHCKNAAKQYQLLRALNRTINLLIYQFTDLDDFLKSQGKEEIRETIKAEIDSLIDYRKKLRQLNKKKNSTK